MAWRYSIVLWSQVPSLLYSFPRKWSVSYSILAVNHLNIVLWLNRKIFKRLLPRQPTPSSFFKNDYFAPLCALNHKLIKRTDTTSKKMIFSIERCSLVLGLLLIVLTARYIYTRLLSRCSLPEILPWVGVGDDGYLSRARATFLSFLHTRDLFQEGYSKVCTAPTSKVWGAIGWLTHYTVLQEKFPIRSSKYHHWTWGNHSSLIHWLASATTGHRPLPKRSQSTVSPSRLHYAPSQSHSWHNPCWCPPERIDQAIGRVCWRYYWWGWLCFQEKLGWEHNEMERGDSVRYYAGCDWQSFKQSPCWPSAL